MRDEREREDLVTDLARAVTALVALLGGDLGGDLDVAGLDARALREALQREVSAHLMLAERCVSTDADVRRRAVRQARAVWAAWMLVEDELQVALGERRGGSL